MRVRAAKFTLVFRICPQYADSNLKETLLIALAKTIRNYTEPDTLCLIETIAPMAQIRNTCEALLIFYDYLVQTAGELIALLRHLIYLTAGCFTL